MPRPQFSIRTLLWLMLVAAAACWLCPPAIREYCFRRRVQRIPQHGEKKLPAPTLENISNDPVQPPLARLRD